MINKANNSIQKKLNENVNKEGLDKLLNEFNKLSTVLSNISSIAEKYNIDLNDVDGFIEAYPFEYSFDEIIYGIYNWVDEMNVCNGHLIEESALNESILTSIEEGKCPKCGNEDLDYDDIQLDGDYLGYEYDCPKCGNKGIEWYSLEYSGETISSQTGEVSKEENICPDCGSEVDYGSLIQDSMGPYYYEYYCPECQGSGNIWFNLNFLENVLDVNESNLTESVLNEDENNTKNKTQDSSPYKKAVEKVNKVKQILKFIKNTESIDKEDLEKEKDTIAREFTEERLNNNEISDAEKDTSINDIKKFIDANYDYIIKEYNKIHKEPKYIVSYVISGEKGGENPIREIFKIKDEAETRKKELNKLVGKKDGPLYPISKIIEESDLKESSEMRFFTVTLKHDGGRVNIKTTASSEEQAIKSVCKAENVPESAVVRVKDNGSVLKESSVNEYRKSFIRKWKNYTDFKCDWCGKVFKGKIDSQGRMPSCPQCLENRYANISNKEDDGYANKDVHFYDVNNNKIIYTNDKGIIEESVLTESVTSYLRIDTPIQIKDYWEESVIIQEYENGTVVVCEYPVVGDNEWHFYIDTGADEDSITPIKIINEEEVKDAVRKYMKDKYGKKSDLVESSLTESVNNKVDEMWDKLIDMGTPEETLQVITAINGYNTETLKDVLYAVYDYRSFDQLENELNESVLKESVSTKGKDLLDFKAMLNTLKNNGKSARRGNWYVGNGGHDLWYEIYYDGTPVIQCVAGSVKNITGDSSFEFYAKLFSEIFGYEYQSMLNNSLDESATGHKEQPMLYAKDGNTMAAKNQFGHKVLGLIIDEDNKQFQLVDGQVLPIFSKYKYTSAKKLREKANELLNQGYTEYKGYGSVKL